jgi:hypothetical protein
MKTTPRTLFLIAILLTVLLSACGPQAETVSGADQQALLAYAEPAAENLLQGYNAHDYATFSKDFDPAMLKSMTSTAFETLYAQINGKIGKYVSRTVAKTDKVQGYLRVTYTAKFENEDGVTMLLVFDPDASHTIAGLFFTSPKLSK